MSPCLSTLDHLVLTVADIPSTVRFYTNVLGMTHHLFTVADGSKRHALSFGTMKINLHQHTAEFEPKARHVQPGSADLCFLTQTPLDVWHVHLSQHAIEVEAGPVSRTRATGPITSLYLRDPDGNLIEIGIAV